MPAFPVQGSQLLQFQNQKSSFQSQMHSLHVADCAVTAWVSCLKSVNAQVVMILATNVQGCASATANDLWRRVTSVHDQADAEECASAARLSSAQQALTDATARHAAAKEELERCQAGIAALLES